MSAPIPPPVPAHATAPDPIFHHLTAIFNYKIEGADVFTHSGGGSDYSFEITLRPYDHSAMHFDEIAQFAGEGTRQQLVQNQFHLSTYFMTSATHFLIFYIRHHPEGVPEYRADSPMFGRIHSAVMDTLRLHSSAGLQWRRTYHFRWPPAQMGGLMSFEPNTSQVRYGHLGAPSILRDSDFDSCRHIFDILFDGNWTKHGGTFTNVLNLAREYHRLAFTLENVAHAFLILMVIFESLFKKDGERNARDAARRIGRLLGTTQTQCNAISQEFFHDAGDTFCRTRNNIAHGDPQLAVSTVASLYGSLYRYATKAIIDLLSMPLGTLDPNKDYYDEIDRIVTNRFDNLPPA